MIAVEEARASAPVEEPSRTLVDRFWENVRTRASLPAMHTRDQQGVWSAVSWEEFGRLVRRMAAFLVAEEVPEGSHVAIWSVNRPEWHIADAATLSTRLRPTPVYFSLSSGEAQYVLGHSEAGVAFVDCAERLERLLAARPGLPALRRVVLFEGSPPPGDDMVIAWEEALARGDRALAAGAGEEVDRRIAAVAADDIATLIYTSGTTGPPKAVMLSHRNVESAMTTLTSVIPVTPDDRVVSYLPLAHIAERIASEFRQYVFGNAVHFCPDMAQLPVVLREVRPTCFFGVPRVWEKVAHRIEAGVEEQPLAKRAVARWALAQGRRAVDRRQAGRAVGPLLRWRLSLADRLVLRTVRESIGLDKATVMITAAAPIAAETLRQLHAVGLEVCELYAMSEDTAVTSVNPMGRARLGTVGPPLPGVDVRIAEDGEILVRCGAVFVGYYKDPEATRETVVDGWLHTGDIGHFDDAGYLCITDRKKDLLITAGGKNISPSNIEVLLKEHPIVANAVAIGDRRPYVSALLTIDPDAAKEFVRHHGETEPDGDLLGHPLVTDELRRHVDAVNAQLASVEQVKRWTVLPGDFAVGEELTPTYKVRRRVVAERYASAIEDNYR